MKKNSNLIFIGIAVLGLIGSLSFVLLQSSRIKNTAISSDNESITSRVIATLESRFAEEPDNIEYAIGLSNAYLQKIRETGDTEFYEKIEKTLGIVSESFPNDSRILAKRAEVANGRHDFKKGLQYIEEALKVDSKVASFYGIKSDSLIELGKYDEAENSLQTMVDIKPDFNSYSRIAYLRELNGDREGAKEALLAAISAGSSYPENTAWAHVELGKLSVPNDVIGARHSFEQALDLYPSYASALEGLGRVAYKEGKKDEAGKYFLQAFESYPIAQYATSLANFYSAEGDEKKAKQYYVLAETAYRDSKDVNVDLEYGIFQTDFGDSEDALRLTESAYKARPSIYGADAYAWALFKNNRIDEAEKYVKEAISLGGYDAILQYHAGVISLAKGKSVEAKSYFKRAKELDQLSSLVYSKSIDNNLR